jgi:hypothetical protein
MALYSTSTHPPSRRVRSSVACVYCHGRVPVTSFVPLSGRRVLVSATCHECGRVVTLASRTLRRLGIPLPALAA